MDLLILGLQLGKFNSYKSKNMTKQIKVAIKNSIDLKNQILLNDTILSKIQTAIELIISSLKEGNRILFCGNGGSAADAQHLAAELSGRFYFDRAPLNSEALHCNTSYLTAVANDYGYDSVYSRMINGSGKKGDILIGLSTSGNSKNIINAFKVANSIGMHTIAFTGKTGGELANCSELLINIPSTDTPRIQEAHMMLGHIVCERVEHKLFSK